MTDGARLERKIRDSGISITFIAEKMKCSRNRIYAILKNDECSASEIVGFATILHLTKKERDEIFLLSDVN